MQKESRKGGDDFMKLDELQKIAKLASVTAVMNNSPEQHELLRQALREEGFDLANLYQELEMSSPYVNTHRDTSYGVNTVSLHSHAYSELIYCRQADGVEYLVGSNRYKLQPGDIVFIYPGVSHCPLMPEQMADAYVRDVIWLSADFTQRIQGIFGEEETWHPGELTPLRTAGTKWEFLGDLFARGVREEEGRKQGWEAAVIGNTLMIVAYLQRIYSQRSGDKIQAEKPELLDRIAACIEENYSSHISATELARRFYVSSSTISHLFKQRMGVSVYRYITQRRLIAAKSRIEAGESMENVALAVGFSDYSGFYRAFKQEYGISPRQYRNLRE
jgi:AraC-like DNA-binding protein